jgi:hypothetical protein
MGLFVSPFSFVADMRGTLYNPSCVWQRRKPTSSGGLLFFVGKGGDLSDDFYSEPNRSVYL